MSAGGPNKEERVMKPIRIGGENVFPDEVEAVLCYHPAIAGAAVIGMSDGRSGEVLVALVAPKPGQTAPSAEEVRQFCIGRLTGFKVPHDVLSVEAIEREGRRVDYEWARTTATALLATPGVP
jgi:acyl-CoA synthetase (AMP-forming)/AMP-acid ligase II